MLPSDSHIAVVWLTGTIPHVYVPAIAHSSLLCILLGPFHDLARALCIELGPDHSAEVEKNMAQRFRSERLKKKKILWRAKIATGRKVVGPCGNDRRNSVSWSGSSKKWMTTNFLAFGRSSIGITLETGVNPRLQGPGVAGRYDFFGSSRNHLQVMYLRIMSALLASVPSSRLMWTLPSFGSLKGRWKTLRAQKRLSRVVDSRAEISCLVGLMR